MFTYEVRNAGLPIYRVGTSCHGVIGEVWVMGNVWKARLYVGLIENHPDAKKVDDEFDSRWFAAETLYDKYLEVEARDVRKHLSIQHTVVDPRSGEIIEWHDDGSTAWGRAAV